MTPSVAFWCFAGSIWLCSFSETILNTWRLAVASCSFAFWPRFCCCCCYFKAYFILFCFSELCLMVACRSFSDFRIFLIIFMSCSSGVCFTPSNGLARFDGDYCISRPSISALLFGFRAYYSLIWFWVLFLPFLSRLRMSQPSCSRKMFFLFRLSLSSLSYFFIGLLRRSIFWKRTCIILAWQRLSYFIFFKCLLENRLFMLFGLGSNGVLVCFFMLSGFLEGDCRGAVGFASPCTILSVF